MATLNYNSYTVRGITLLVAERYKVLCLHIRLQNYLAHMLIEDIADRDLFFTESTLVGGYDVGPSYGAYCHRLVEIMHDASTRHVLMLKLSARELQRLHLTWVLIRQRIEIKQQPTLGDQLVVKTYPSGKDRLYTYRDFVVRDRAGETMVSSSSTWLLMNTDERKVGAYPEDIAALLDRSNKIEALPRAEKLKISFGQAEVSTVRTVQQSDLDFNAHLSSPHYYRWMLDVLPVAYCQSHSLVEITIQLQHEGCLHDKVQVEAAPVADGWEHKLRIGDKILAVGRSLFSGR